MNKENRSMIATLLIWGLIAIGVMTLLSWVLPSVGAIIGAAFWFFIGFFVGRNTLKKNRRNNF